MRVKGSCRFEPYYKVQRWDAAAMAWKDIQKGYQSETEARLAAPGGRVRLMRVTEQGREPGTEWES